MTCSIKNIGIKGIGYYVPENIITNEKLGEMLGVDPIKLSLLTGVEERRWVTDDQALSDLAIEAGKRAMEDAEVLPEEIDIIVLNTCSGDFAGPATGCLVQDKLGLREDSMVLNLNQACAGGMYALSTAARFMLGDTYKKALVIAGDINSRFVSFNIKDGFLSSVLGDGASAVVLEKLKSGYEGIIAEDFNCKGQYFDIFGLFNYGSRIPREELGEGKEYIVSRYDRNGTLLSLVLDWFKNTFENCLQKSGLKQEDLDLIVPHPAAISQIYQQLDTIGADYDKNLIVTDKFGHCSSGTVFIILKEALKKGKVNVGDKMFFFANGAGFQQGGVILRWCGKDEFRN